MSMDIGPGDWVECVNAAPSANGWRGEWLEVGAVYEVQRLVDFGSSRCGLDQCGSVGLLVKGVPIETGQGVCPNRFRPIHRGNTNLIESLKEIASKPLVCDPA